jgi:hypothetical protein
MMRVAGSVIVGYLVIIVLVFATFTVTYLAMGTDGAFRPGTYDVTALWLFVSFLLSFVVAIVGGLVCATIAQHRAGSIALATVVLVGGLLLAIPAVPAQPPLVARGPDVGIFQAMRHAHRPTWAVLLSPIVGALGVLVGGQFVVRRTGALGDA